MWLRTIFPITVFWAVCLAVSNADTITYNYTGNDFTSVYAPYTTSNFISGSFTTSSSLGTGLNAANITSQVLSFSFTDGSINTITPINAIRTPALFTFGTDSQGNITAWLVDLISGTPPTNFALFSCYGSIPLTFGGSCSPDTPGAVGPFDESYIDNSAIQGSNSSDPGTWTQTVNGLPGGPTSAPVFLLGGPASAGVSGTIAGQGASDYYLFNWGGGVFSASASVAGANPGASYLFSEGVTGSCNSSDQTLNNSDSFSSTISIANLAPGQYCIGIDANSPNDPNFTLTFNTPVQGAPVQGVATPEPSTFVLLSTGLGLACLPRLTKRSRKRSQIFRKSLT